MTTLKRRERFVAEAKVRRQKFRREERLHAKSRRKAPPVDDPLVTPPAKAELTEI